MKIRAAVLEQSGLAAPYAVSQPLKVREVDLAGPGHGEVLVRIEAAGLCHSDLSVIDGNRPRPLPMVLGHEAAGVVEALGPEVNDLAVGDHVVLVFMPSCGGCIPCADLWIRLGTLGQRYGWKVRTIGSQEAMLRSGRLGLPWVGHPVA